MMPGVRSASADGTRTGETGEQSFPGQTEATILGLPPIGPLLAVRKTTKKPGRKPEQKKKKKKPQKKPEPAAKARPKKVSRKRTPQPPALIKQRLGTCRLCNADITTTFVDLGMSPLRGTSLTRDDLASMERYYPLHALVCSNCYLVQLKDVLPPAEMLSEYAGLPAASPRRLQDHRRFSRTIVKRLNLGPDSLAIEIGGHGNFLPHIKELDVPVLSIDPHQRSAHQSIDSGIATRVETFTEKLARELAARGKLGDVIIGGDVIAQVPDLHDLVAGIARLLKPRGVAILEFPYAERLIVDTQFDAIHHDQLSYLSLSTLERLVGRHKLKITEAHELSHDGGSLRVLLSHSSSARPLNNSVARILGHERKSGIFDLKTYTSFSQRSQALKRKLLSFLISSRNSGQTICGCGTPSHANTLFHFCGIGPDFLDFLIDSDPNQHGRFTPGKRIPIMPPEALRATKPDFVLILPWHLQGELMKELHFIKEWGGKFIVSTPDFLVIDPTTLEA
ncbi:MAG: methyltransferase domain-containing protein [Hyphomicrobiaceae bacterium]|nr:methyltransferase domain-containing protein [Hyphomicrobiaceae bacterium]